MNILSNYKLSLVVCTKLSDTEKGNSDANKIKLRVCVFIKKERKTKHDAHFFHLRDIKCQLGWVCIRIVAQDPLRYATNIC